MIFMAGLSAMSSHGMVQQQQQSSQTELAIVAPDIMRFNTIPEETTLPNSAIREINWSSRGPQIISHSADNTISICNIKTNETQILCDHIDQKNAVSLSPDGHHMAVGMDHNIQIYNYTTGSLQRVLIEHTSGVTLIRWSADSSKFISGSLDGTIRMWDAKTGEQLQVLRNAINWLNPHDWLLNFMGKSINRVHDVSWTPDGKYIAFSESRDNVIRIWDVEQQTVIREFGGHADAVLSLDWSPDGQWLASGSINGRICMHHRDGKVHVLKGHNGNITSVSFSHDGKYLASGSTDQSIRLWSTETQQELQVLPSPTHARSVKWAPDDTALVSASMKNIVCVWEMIQLTLPQKTLIDKMIVATTSYFAFSTEEQAIYEGLPVQCRQALRVLEQTKEIAQLNPQSKEQSQARIAASNELMRKHKSTTRIYHLCAAAPLALGACWGLFKIFQWARGQRN